ncbi:unnamed protein product [Ixodes hexagonus]
MMTFSTCIALNARNQETTKMTKNLRKQIEEHDKLHYGGAAVRTRTLQVIEGEQPTKRYLNAEREYVKKKRIEKIQENGRVLTNEKKIEDAFVASYENIFASTPLTVTTQIFIIWATNATKRDDRKPKHPDRCKRG